MQLINTINGQSAVKLLHGIQVLFLRVFSLTIAGVQGVSIGSCEKLTLLHIKSGAEKVPGRRQ